MSVPVHRHTLHAPVNVSERLADRVADAVGSWTFIWSYLALTAVWTLVNALGLYTFDPYPFIFYTFSVSCLAILMSSLILLSQNRQARKDRARDDLEAQEVDLLLRINHQQLELLTTLHELLAEKRTVSEANTTGPKDRTSGVASPFMGDPNGTATNA